MLILVVFGSRKVTKKRDEMSCLETLADKLSESQVSVEAATK